jgi:hypothetical protein
MEDALDFFDHHLGLEALASSSSYFNDGSSNDFLVFVRTFSSMPRFSYICHDHVIYLYIPLQHNSSLSHAGDSRPFDFDLIKDGSL